MPDSHSLHSFSPGLPHTYQEDGPSTPQSFPGSGCCSTPHKVLQHQWPWVAGAQQAFISPFGSYTHWEFLKLHHAGNLGAKSDSGYNGSFTCPTSISSIPNLVVLPSCVYKQLLSGLAALSETLVHTSLGKDRGRGHLYLERQLCCRERLGTQEELEISSLLPDTWKKKPQPTKKPNT